MEERRRADRIMEKNQQFQVTITDYSSEGLGIGKTEGQFVWFIKDTVIGDEVIAAATKVKKHYGFARLVKLVTPSPSMTFTSWFMVISTPFL